MKTRIYIKSGPHIISSATSYYAFGKPVFDAGVAPYIELDLLPEGVILPELLLVMVICSRHQTFYGGGESTMRQIGLYRHQDAKAVVERNASGLHTIKAEAPTMDGLDTICRLICAGSIAPVDSYQDGQVKYSSLRQAIREGWREVLRHVRNKFRFKKTGATADAGLAS